MDDFSTTHKYIQIANSIIKAISEGKIQKNGVLPSINTLSNEFQISRDTVEKGYKQRQSAFSAPSPALALFLTMKHRLKRLS